MNDPYSEFDLLSVGHSKHPIEGFIDLLTSHSVGAVVDVRSSPWSSYNPHFNRQNLEYSLGEAGVSYVFLGDSLGGRPRTEELYDDGGHALYGEMAKTDEFHEGVDRLLGGARRFNVAMMCSEEDPANCHRFLLVTRVLYQLGKKIGHIRGSGRLVRTEEVSTFKDWADPDYVENSLFGGTARSSWRSTQPVLQRSQQRPSSVH